MTARAVLLVVIVAVLLIASVGAVIRCEGSPPQLAGPSDVELGRFGAYKRVCRTCCDAADCVMPGAFSSQDSSVPPCPMWKESG